MPSQMTPDWSPSSQVLQVLEQLGTHSFYDAFLDWLHEEFGTEQCMVFYCADGHQVSTLLFKDYAREASARQLAEAYVEERHYLQDPNFSILKTIAPGEVQVVRFDSVSSDMGLHYRKAFFESPGFLDKLAIIRELKPATIMSTFTAAVLVSTAVLMTMTLLVE